MDRNRNARRYGRVAFLIAVVAACGAGSTLRAEEPFAVEVNILSAKITADGNLIGTAKRGDKLTAHEARADSYLVDVPGANPPKQGWVNKQEVHRVEDPLAEHKRRLALLPADQRQKAAADFKVRRDDLAQLEKRFKELDAKHQWRESLPVAKQVAEMAEELYGRSTFTADKLEILGNRHYDLGDYVAARKCHEQALVAYRTVLGEKHASTAMPLNNLGLVAQDLGDYPAARRNFEQALAICREALGEKHPHTAGSLNNLGVVAQDLGDYPAARATLSRPWPSSVRSLARNTPTPRGRSAIWAVWQRIWGTTRRRVATTSRPWRSAVRSWARSTPTPPPRSAVWATSHGTWRTTRRRDATTSRPWRSAVRSWAKSTPPPPAR